MDGLKSSMEKLEAYIHDMNLDEYREYKDNKEDEPFTLLNLLKSIVNGVFKLISVAVRPIGDAVDTMIVNPIMRKRYSYIQL